MNTIDMKSRLLLLKREVRRKITNFAATIGFEVAKTGIGISRRFGGGGVLAAGHKDGRYVKVRGKFVRDMTSDEFAEYTEKSGINVMRTLGGETRKQAVAKNVEPLRLCSWCGEQGHVHTDDISCPYKLAGEHPEILEGEVRPACFETEDGQVFATVEVLREDGWHQIAVWETPVFSGRNAAIGYSEKEIWEYRRTAPPRAGFVHREEDPDDGVERPSPFFSGPDCCKC